MPDNRISFRVPGELYKLLREIARRVGTNPSALVKMWLINYFIERIDKLPLELEAYAIKVKLKELTNENDHWHRIWKGYLRACTRWGDVKVPKLEPEAITEPIIDEKRKEKVKKLIKEGKADPKAIATIAAITEGIKQKYEALLNRLRQLNRELRKRAETIENELA